MKITKDSTQQNGSKAAVFLYCFYKLDKIYPPVMAELEQRERQGKL